MSVIQAYGFHLLGSVTDLVSKAVQTSGSTGNFAIVSDLAGEGAQGIEIEGPSWLALPIPSDPGTSWTMHFWFTTDTWAVADGTSVALALTDSSGNRGIYLEVDNSSTNILVKRGATTLYDHDRSGGDVFSYQLKVVEHATEGEIEFWEDGVLVYSDSDIDTSRTSAFTADRIRFAAANDGRPTRWSHVILTDGENLGESALVKFFPVAADVAPNEWAKSNAGLGHYEHLDEEPNNGDTDYLGSDTAAEKTRHTCAVSFTDRRIVSARPALVARLESAGSDRIKITTESGAAAAVEDIIEDFDTSYKLVEGGWQDTDPDTSAEWTEAGLSALEVEVEHLAPEV